MVSPYYVHPGGEWGQGLAGLAQSITQAGQMQSQREYQRKMLEMQQAEENRKQSNWQRAENRQILLDQLNRGIDFPDQIPEIAAAAGRQDIIDSYNKNPERTLKIITKMRDRLQRTTGGQYSQRPVASHIYGNGLVQIVGAQGESIVKDAAGKVLEGDEATAAIDAAKKYDIDMAALKTSEIKRAGFKEEDLRSIVKEIGGIRNKTSILQDAINIIDTALQKGEYLGIGPVQQFLPKWTATSAQLQNIATQLGLATIAAGKFGPLSEGEMKVAMTEAMPPGLKGKALRDWLVRKKTAQENVMANLIDLARYMRNGGSQLEWQAQFIEGGEKTNNAKGNQLTTEGQQIKPINEMALHDLINEYKNIVDSEKTMTGDQ